VDDAGVAPIRLGIVGLGKIARDHHIPSLVADPRFQLVAAATTSGDSPVDIPVYSRLTAMIAATPELHAVTIATPPQVRYALACEALDHRMHVMLEKPPGVSVGEVEELVARARAGRVALFASWHLCAAPAMPMAREWVAGRVIRKVVVTWKENVRRWHPGQTWIWQPGGLGVFDPGINAISMVTNLMPRPLFVTEAVLHVPANRQAPIAAELVLADGAGATIEVQLDFREAGDERWDIVIEADAGQLALRRLGTELEIDGHRIPVEPPQEYRHVYDRFAEVIHSRAVDADLAPLKLVADAFLMSRRIEVEPFDE
jgi:D-galactose 1-dehydrogenase